MRLAWNRSVIIWLFMIPLGVPLADAQQRKEKKVASNEEYLAAINISVSQELQTFPSHEEGSSYSITLCADVPNNKKPEMVAHNQQTGHVFLILKMIRVPDTICQVFGFYPKRGLPTLLFKTIRSVIKDNSKREHDAFVTRSLTRMEFDSVLERSISLARRIYHINKFNCYDYAVHVFNTASGKDSIPLNHVRFPAPFGKGGSPVGLYRDLKELKNNGSSWANAIEFGDFIAPVSSTRVVAGKNERKK